MFPRAAKQIRIRLRNIDHFLSFHLQWQAMLTNNEHLDYDWLIVISSLISPFMPRTQRRSPKNKW